jgi:V/A-type H+-transporting ATPase subunit D
MAEPYADLPPSRAALLEIQADRQVMEEGYGFLDEKRVLVAQELLKRLDDYCALLDTFQRTRQDAYRSLAAALGQHGLEGLRVYPALPGGQRLDSRVAPFLGVQLMEEAQWREPEGGASPEPAWPSPEAEECARAFRELVSLGARLAAAEGNLRRLLAEYRHTERRAQALENVIIPETRAAEGRMQGLLEEAEQEEAVRIRLFTGGGGGAGS